MPVAAKSGMASAAGGAARSRMSAALGIGEAAESGRQAAFNALANRGPAASNETDASSMPRWARAMKAQQSTRHHGQAAMHAVQQGERGGHSATPDIKERDD